MTISLRRVLGVTLGLIVTGEVCGAILGAFTAVVDLAAAPHFTVLAGVAGFVGAAIWLWVTTSARHSASMSPPDTER
jgi:hypothetical protein